MKFNIVVAIIPEEREEEAISVAKEAGAIGVTVINGRGVGLHEKKIFFGLTYEEKESVMLFILPKNISINVLKNLKTKMNLDKEHGMAFSIPIENIVGLDIDQAIKFEKEIENSL